MHAYTPYVPTATIQEENYWRGRQRREDQLAVLRHNLSAIKPFDEWGPIYIWDWFNPDYVCPSMERVGRVGDGGKWMCDLEALRRRPKDLGRPCIVYAFGVNVSACFVSSVGHSKMPKSDGTLTKNDNLLPYAHTCRTTPPLRRSW